MIYLIYQQIYLIQIVIYPTCESLPTNTRPCPSSSQQTGRNATGSLQTYTFYIRISMLFSNSRQSYLLFIDIKKCAKNKLAQTLDNPNPNAQKYSRCNQESSPQERRKCSPEPPESLEISCPSPARTSKTGAKGQDKRANKRAQHNKQAHEQTREHANEQVRRASKKGNTTSKQKGK